MNNGPDPSIEIVPTPSGDKPRIAVLIGNLTFSDRIFLMIENPVLRRELLTSLRSNKAFILQFFYLLALGAVIYLAWPLTASTKSDLARKLFHVFGQSQLVLISMLAPAFSASAMTMEKERRCIDLLMTSPIRPDTILMGKYMSSVLYLFILVLSTAPLASIMFWVPGLGPGEVAGLYILLIAVAATFGMVGLTCSVFFHRSQSSLAITYMIVLPLVLILFICATQFDGFFLLESAVWPAALLLISSVVMYRASYARLRQPFDPVFKAAEDENRSSQTGLILIRDRFPDNLLAPNRNDELLPDGVNPVYQKEIRSEIFGRGTLFLRMIISISMFMSVLFLTSLYVGHESLFVYYLIIFTMLVAPAFACNTFTQERERGTLDLLLTTLVSPGQIISGKFLSCMRLSLFLTGLISITMFFFLIVGHDTFLHRAAYLLVYALILFTTIVFETSLAMSLSLIFKSTVQSMIVSYTTILLLFGVPVAAFELLGAFAKFDRNDIVYLLIFSPFEAVYSVNPFMGMSGALKPDLITIWPSYIGLYLALSFLLMCWVYGSFERKCLEHNSRS